MKIISILLLLMMCFSQSMYSEGAQENFITVEQCDFDSDEMFLLMAAAEQHVLFTYEKNLILACDDKKTPPTEVEE